MPTAHLSTYFIMDKFEMFMSWEGTGTGPWDGGGSQVPVPVQWGPSLTVFSMSISWGEPGPELEPGRSPCMRHQVFSLNDCKN